MNDALVIFQYIVIDCQEIRMFIMNRKLQQKYTLSISNYYK